MFLDPSQIQVKEKRQRTDLGDLTELKASIKNTGQISPIVVRRIGDEIVLIAGGRRLRACLELERTVEVKFWDELDDTDAEIIELEENIKREDLPWRDKVSAVARVHEMRKKTKENWNSDALANELGWHRSTIDRYLIVARNLANPILKDSTDIMHAYGVLQRVAERKSADIVAGIAAEAAQVFAPNQAKAPLNGAPNGPVGAPSGSEAQYQIPIGITSTAGPKPPNIVPEPPQPPPVLNLSFLTWAPAYTGPKFNLIHCDFPYGIKFTGGMGQEEHGIKYEEDEGTYWALLDCLCSNTERLSSYSSHLVFWFTMNFYIETCQKLRSAGWKVQDHPLIWYKSDGQGIVPGRNEYPRRIYETALLASRGQRPLCKMFDNVKAAPRSSGTGFIHPSQKPEPVLRHFFEGVVDNTTDMLDPTCGSATALRAAEDVGARSVLGLELNLDFAKAANAATVNARRLRLAAK